MEVDPLPVSQVPPFSAPPPEQKNWGKKPPPDTKKWRRKTSTWPKKLIKEPPPDKKNEEKKPDLNFNQYQTN